MVLQAGTGQNSHASLPFIGLLPSSVESRMQREENTQAGATLAPQASCS
jgi:hypothetical protein